MRRFVVGLFAAIGLFWVLAVIGVGVAVWRLAPARPALPATIVLDVDLASGLASGAGPDALSQVLFGGKPTLRDVVDALDRAGRDPRVKGVYARLGPDNLGLATVQEVRDAIRDFRAKGRFAIGFADSFGEFGPGTRPYYLAAAFDEIWMQPLGSLGLIGLHMQTPFLRGALDKLGIDPEFAHREEYKTAMDLFTKSEMTPAQREETNDLLNSAEGQIAQGIANDRKMSAQQVATLIDRGPFTAEEAKAAKLVDRVGYRDEAIARARARAGSGATRVSVGKYLKGAGRPDASGPKIALIFGTGLITAGGNDDKLTPLSNIAVLSADKVARALRQAAGDKDVRAILFRIDSPGGSAMASETIWREVVRARARGKPVIVSMGELAGSGGYYIAAPANKIVAEPATLTGSIGIVAGKFVLSDLLKKLGITTESVQRGANAAMFSALDGFTPVARQRLEAFLDTIYQGFKEHVSAGRHLTPEQVEAVAKGRVWSGEEAKAKGLVDALGGYDVALRLAKQAAGIPTASSVDVTVFPRRKSALARIYDRLARLEDDRGALLLQAPGAVQGIAELAASVAAVLHRPDVLQMPAIGEIR